MKSMNHLRHCYKINVRLYKYTCRYQGYTVSHRLIDMLIHMHVLLGYANPSATACSLGFRHPPVAAKDHGGANVYPKFEKPAAHVPKFQAFRAPAEMHTQPAKVQKSQHGPTKKTEGPTHRVLLPWWRCEPRRHISASINWKTCWGSWPLTLPNYNQSSTMNSVRLVPAWHCHFFLRPCTGGHRASSIVKDQDSCMALA